VSGYLLDTDIVSEARKGQRANPKVLAWLETVKDDGLFLSVLVLGEIRKGVELAKPAEPRRARALEQWLDGLERNYADRVLPVSAAVADRWGRLGAIRPLSTVDGLLAATALVHKMTLVTRNVRDVERTGVRLLNPFEL
jgi:predicted nucleic acid-binding protein